MYIATTLTMKYSSFCFGLLHDAISDYIAHNNRINNELECGMKWSWTNLGIIPAFTRKDRGKPRTFLIRTSSNPADVRTKITSVTASADLLSVKEKELMLSVTDVRLIVCCSAIFSWEMPTYILQPLFSIILVAVNPYHHALMSYLIHVIGVWPTFRV